MKRNAIIFFFFAIASCQKKEVNPNLKCYRCEYIAAGTTQECMRKTQYFDTCVDFDPYLIDLEDYCGNDLHIKNCVLR